MTSTASAALYEVRTGFLYGVAAATATEEKRATVWSSTEAIDNGPAERGSRGLWKMVGEVEKLSGDALRQHGKAAAARS